MASSVSEGETANIKDAVNEFAGESSKIGTPFSCIMCNESTSHLQKDGLLKQVCDNCFQRSRQDTYSKFLNNKLGSCNVCSASFSHNEERAQHICTHYDAFICDHCGKVFNRLLFLKRHMLRRHFVSSNAHSSQPATEQMIMCSLCNETFRTDSELKTHVVVHAMKMTYTCNMCDKTFHHLSNLMKHTYKHTKEKKKHVCNVCNETFSKRCDLSSHANTHTKEKLATPVSKRLRI